jgi:hypothetical protein
MIKGTIAKGVEVWKGSVVELTPDGTFIPFTCRCGAKNVFSCDCRMSYIVDRYIGEKTYDKKAIIYEANDIIPIQVEKEFEKNLVLAFKESKDPVADELVEVLFKGHKPRW